MRETVKVLELDKYEIGIIINALNEFRNRLLREKEDTEPVDEVLLKAIDAVIVYLTSRNAPFLTCFFKCHVVHICTSDNISYYISSTRRIQASKYE